jgi:hypothetical protein
MEQNLPKGYSKRRELKRRVREEGLGKEGIGGISLMCLLSSNPAQLRNSPPKNF